MSLTVLSFSDSNPWPRVTLQKNYFSEFCTVWYTDFKYETQRALVSDHHYLVLADVLS